MQFNMAEDHVALYSIHASIPPFYAKEWRKRNNKVNTYLPLSLSILFLCMFCECEYECKYDCDLTNFQEFLVFRELIWIHF